MEPKCKSGPLCSHNRNGRDLDKPCSISFPFKQTPAPEKKWEELLLKAHVYDEFRYYDAEGEPTQWKVDYEKLKAIIATILEEKAVQVEAMHVRTVAREEIRRQAAAILRR